MISLGSFLLSELGLWWNQGVAPGTEMDLLNSLAFPLVLTPG